MSLKRVAEAPSEPVCWRWMPLKVLGCVMGAESVMGCAKAGSSGRYWSLEMRAVKVSSEAVSVSLQPRRKR